MLGLKKKCAYCRNPVEKGKEFQKDVKKPGYVGTFRKDFCSEEHAMLYEKELNGMPRGSGGGCCG